MSTSLYANGSFPLNVILRGLLSITKLNWWLIGSPWHTQSVHIRLSLLVNHGWSLYQLDISNVFLNGNLIEHGIMERPLGYSFPRMITKVCHLHRAILWSEAKPSCMVCHVQPSYPLLGVNSHWGRSHYFSLIYSYQVCYPCCEVDDIFVIMSDATSIARFKAYLH